MQHLDRIRSYSELIALDGFLSRFKYLELGGSIGSRTFGGNRYLNQIFYHSKEWKDFRRDIILRDNGCDLGVDGWEIHGRIYIHHINPITELDIKNRSDSLLDPENAICVSLNTHEAIHYGDISLLPIEYSPRCPNDTCPWKGAK